jgi:hypothetical protein
MHSITPDGMEDLIRKGKAHTAEPHRSQVPTMTTTTAQLVISISTLSRFLTEGQISAQP